MHATVEDLREIGRQIDAGLRSGNDAGLRVAGKNLRLEDLRRFFMHVPPA